MGKMILLIEGTEDEAERLASYGFKILAQTEILSESARPAPYYENIYRDRQGMFRHTSFALEQRLVLDVCHADEASALKTLIEINDEGDKAVLAAEPLRSAKNSVICSCAILARAAIQAGVFSDAAFALSDAAIQFVETLTCKQDVLDYERTMLSQFIRLVRDRPAKDYSTPVRRAMHYIDGHLECRSPLTEIAAYAGVHPNYLSRVFKQETGVTVTAYQLDRKIREAAYFVARTDYTFAAIAALYGFADQSHFTVAFRKIMGTTPGKHRKSP